MSCTKRFPVLNYALSLNLRNLQDILVCYMLSSAHHEAKELLQTYTFESLSRLYNKKDQGCAKRDGRVSVTTYYRLLHEPEIEGFS